MKINYCSKCVLPDTRPQINFNYTLSTCDACLNTTKKNKINWPKRKKNFEELIEKIKKKKKNL